MIDNSLDIIILFFNFYHLYSRDEDSGTMKVLKDTEDEKPPPLPPKTHVRITYYVVILSTNKHG